MFNVGFDLFGAFFFPIAIGSVWSVAIVYAMFADVEKE